MIRYNCIKRRRSYYMHNRPVQWFMIDLFFFVFLDRSRSLKVLWICILHKYTPLKYKNSMAKPTTLAARIPTAAILEEDKIFITAEKIYHSALLIFFFIAYIIYYIIYHLCIMYVLHFCSLLQDCAIAYIYI